MEFFRIKNYEDYQAKKTDRNTMPWIKLHKKMMNDWEYGELSVGERLMYVHMLLVADSVNNRFPMDTKWLHRKLQVKASLEIEKFERLGFIEIIGRSVKKKKSTRREEIRREDINLKESRGEPASLILEVLNTQAMKKYKPTDTNLDFIKARLSEGYTQEDCETVIKNRVAYWKDDAKMAEFIRPATLFCKKNFPGYLNAPMPGSNGNGKSKLQKDLDRLKEVGDEWINETEDTQKKGFLS